MNRLFVIVGLAAALATGTANAGTGSSTADLLAPATACAASGVDEAAQLAQMACLVEYARSRAGLAPLRETTTLDRAAALKAAADLRCKQFSHTPCSQQFDTVFLAAGYSLANDYEIGENLAYGQGPGGSPRQIMKDWLASPPHRQNLLSPGWRSFGIAVRADTTFLGARHITIWVNEFGSK